jgi:heme/copper-type cytochrome/quinol oxidase subunit 2
MKKTILIIISVMTLTYSCTHDEDKLVFSAKADIYLENICNDLDSATALTLRNEYKRVLRLNAISHEGRLLIVYKYDKSSENLTFRDLLRVIPNKTKTNKNTQSETNNSTTIIRRIVISILKIVGVLLMAYFISRLSNTQYRKFIVNHPISSMRGSARAMSISYISIVVTTLSILYVISFIGTNTMIFKIAKWIAVLILSLGLLSIIRVFFKSMNLLVEERKANKYNYNEKKYNDLTDDKIRIKRIIFFVIVFFVIIMLILFNINNRRSNKEKTKTSISLTAAEYYKKGNVQFELRDFGKLRCFIANNTG